MLYSSYREKLSKRRNVFDRIWRFRAPILVGSVLVLASAGTLLGVKGIVYGEEIPQEVVYGESLAASAGSVFGDVEFEYRAVGGEEWTSEEPVLVGDYECRAVSESIVGTGRFGDIHSYRIVPARVEITVIADSPFVYGETPDWSAELKYEDTLTVGGFLSELETEPGGNLSLVADSSKLRATNAAGEDVTECYEFVPVIKNVQDARRPITVRMSSDTFGYDGAPHASESYEIISETGLIEGHTLEATYPAQTEAGSRKNVFESYRILDENGEVVTARYDILLVEGTITVTKRKLTVTTPSDSIFYDGAAHAYADIGSDGNLADGQTLVRTDEFAPTNAGSYPNAAEYKVIDAAGVDVTANYEFTNNFGAIEIKPLPLTVSTSSPTPVTYDGTEHVFGDITVEGELVTGHELARTNEISVKNAGEYKNTAEYQVTDGAGTDVTANYEISIKEFGTITVTKRHVTVQTATEEFTYDGEPHIYEDIEVDTQKGDGLATGQRLERTNKVTVRNVKDSCENTATYRIVDANGDVTDNYEFTKDFGTITITPFELAVTAESGGFTYDGKPHTYKVEAIDTLANETHGYEVLNPLTVTDVGTGAYTNAPKSFGDGESGGGPILRIFETLDGGEQIDVTANYIISITSGEVTVTKRPVQFRTADREWTYDGQEHKQEDCEVVETSEDRGLCEGHSCVPEEATTVKKFTENPTDNVLKIAIYDENKNPVTDNYEVGEQICGDLTIIKRHVTVQTATNTWTYDGTAHTDPTLVFGGDKIAEGQTCHYNVPSALPSITEVGTVTNEFAYSDLKILDGNNVDVTDNYEFEEVPCGTLTVTARPLCILTNSDTVLYDGQEHSAAGYTLLDDDMLVKGHELKLEYLKETDAGTYTNKPISYKIMKGEADVTKNYDISWGNTLQQEEETYGTLTITKRTLGFTSLGATWVYDAQRHEKGEYKISEDEKYDGLADGQTIDTEKTKISIGEEAHITEVGTKENKLTFSELVIKDKGGNDVTKNYETPQWTYGNLVVTKRPIKVESRNVEWTYNGGSETCEMHGEPEEALYSITYYNNTPLEGHEVKVDFSDYLFLDAGTYENAFTVTITAGGKDVAGNYDLTIVYGSVTINKRPIKITSASDTFVYQEKDGAAVEYSNPEFTAEKEGEEGNDRGLISNPRHEHKVQVHKYTTLSEVTDSETKKGTKDNVLEIAIYDENGEDVTKNYDLELHWGKLRVKKPIEVLIYSRKKIYDATPLSFEDGDYLILTAPVGVKKEDVTITLIGSLTNAGALSMQQIYEASVKEVTQDEFSGDAGNENRIDFLGDPIPLAVQLRPITISTATIRVSRRDTALRGDEVENWYWVSMGSIAPGQKLVCTFDEYYTLTPDSIMPRSNKPILKIVDSQGQEIDPSGKHYNYNYSIQCKYGTLEWLD